MRHCAFPALALGTILLVASCAKESSDNATAPAPLPIRKKAATNAGNAPAANAPAANAASTITQKELDAVGKASRPLKLALVVKTRNNPFFDPMIKGAEATAKDLGVDLEVEAPEQETDKEKQFAMVQTLAAKGVDAILIAPADSKGIVPALKEAQDKKIVVINLDNRVDRDQAASAGLTLDGYVGADNTEGGRMAGRAMVDALHGHGKVAVLEGIRGADNAEARKSGFEEAVKGKLDVVASDSANWDTQQAYQKFQSMQSANPSLDGLFCANDKMAVGALKAIEEAGKTGKITVIGYDNIPDVQTYLKNGELYATIEQHPDLMGTYGVKMAVGVLGGSVPKGKDFLVPLELITHTHEKTARALDAR